MFPILDKYSLQTVVRFIRHPEEVAHPDSLANVTQKYIDQECYDCLREHPDLCDALLEFLKEEIDLIRISAFFPQDTERSEADIAEYQKQYDRREKAYITYEVMRKLIAPDNKNISVLRAVNRLVENATG